MLLPLGLDELSYWWNNAAIPAARTSFLVCRHPLALTRMVKRSPTMAICHSLGLVQYGNMLYTIECEREALFSFQDIPTILSSVNATGVAHRIEDFEEDRIYIKDLYILLAQDNIDELTSPFGTWIVCRPHIEATVLTCRIQRCVKGWLKERRRIRSIVDVMLKEFRPMGYGCEVFSNQDIVHLILGFIAQYQKD